tara:strand:+ start:345 stop:809 length:465 start_codon:yes stop_codon:yes gene_type:complete
MANKQDKKEEKSNKFDTPETREMVRSWVDKKKDTQHREVLNPKKKKTDWEKKQAVRVPTQKLGGNVIFADEWDKIDPGLKKGIGLKKGGKVKRKNTSRENRLEELGRVDAEKAYSRKGKRNLKSEKKRIVRELHSHGGSAGAVMSGKKVGIQIR